MTRNDTGAAPKKAWKTPSIELLGGGGLTEASSRREHGWEEKA